jgi:hypothetical protein
MKIDRLRAAGELVAVKSCNSQQGHVEITVASLEATSSDNWKPSSRIRLGTTSRRLPLTLDTGV